MAVLAIEAEGAQCDSNVCHRSLPRTNKLVLNCQTADSLSGVSNFPLRLLRESIPLTRSAIVIKNIFDPTEGREKTNSVALAIAGILSVKPYFSVISFAASKAGRDFLMLSTTRSWRRPGGNKASIGRSIGTGYSLDSRSVRISRAEPFWSLATTFPTLEKPHRSLSVYCQIGARKVSRIRHTADTLETVHAVPVDEYDISLLRLVTPDLQRAHAAIGALHLP